jgi:hypothetical protein
LKKMAKSLTNASKNAASAVSRLTSNRKTSPEAAPNGGGIKSTKANATVAIGGDSRVHVNVPGLFEMSEQSIPSMLPPFNPNAYSVSDPLNPPDSIPQATGAQFERGKRIYEGGIRALQLTGLAMDLTREKFVVIGKQAKAVGAGFNALTDQEKAKGSYLDWKSSLEATQQKGINYQVATYTTAQEIAALPFVKIQLDEALAQQQAKAQFAQAKTAEALGKLGEFKASIGKYLEPQKSV